MAVVRLGHRDICRVVQEQPKGYHTTDVAVALGERPWSEALKSGRVSARFDHQHSSADSTLFRVVEMFQLAGKRIDMGLFDAIKRLLGMTPKPPSLPRRNQAIAPDSSFEWLGPATFKPMAGAPQSKPMPQVTASFGPDPLGASSHTSAANQGDQRSGIRERPLDLDAADFKPLSADQVRERASGQIFSGFFEFGRRDRIPSAVDPRTKLIDQAMVGHGLITPEELVRIHEVGAKMEEVRPDLAGAHVLAQRAVEADKEERKRIKAAKKAAAEQRKRNHAARVASNKLNDIIHLGRGVSSGLADRRSNIEKLTKQSLPILSTPSDVAAAMGIAIPKLRWLAFHAEASTVTHYVRFVIPKKSGGERTLSAPHKQLAATQRWILDHVLNKLPAHDVAHGFVAGRSILTNARPHVGAKAVVNCDLTDFFPSITVHRVIGLFREIGYSPAVATILALLATDCPRRSVVYAGKTWHVATGPRGLPQGACTSPAISNLIARRLDSRLSGIARKLGWTYTRYADDLTFSIQESPDKVGYLLARIRHITQDEGFSVNEKKTRVLKPAARQSVTGVVVNAHPSTPRATRRKLRAILHNAGRTSLAQQNRSRRSGFEEWLAGIIGYVAMVNGRQAVRLREAFARLNGQKGNG